MAGAPVCPAGVALLQPRELSGDVGVCLLREVPAWGSPGSQRGSRRCDQSQDVIGGKLLAVGGGGRMWA